MKQATIIAIIVTYFPDEQILTKTIKSIVKQVSRLLIIDNTTNGSNIFKNHKLLDRKNNVKLIAINENVGIAKAQNIGIKRALESKAEFILLSDQDTFYPDNYITKMLEAYSKIANKEKIAAIAPDFAELNRGGERQGFVLFDSIFSKRIFPQSGCHEITQAIASGKIIPSEMFNYIGFMNEELFIDWVDFEWCWRARAKGYKIVGCADVIIEHFLGDVVKEVGLKSYSIRSPIRDYYIIRNAIHLALRSEYITFGMRLNILMKSIKYIIGFTILGKPHWKHFIYSLKGFYHGITKKLGGYK
jgi:rhamnosyltransferase